MQIDGRIFTGWHINQGIFITGYNNSQDGIALQLDGATNFTINDVLVNENLPGGGRAAIFITGGSTGTFMAEVRVVIRSESSVAGGGVNVEGG